MPELFGHELNPLKQKYDYRTGRYESLVGRLKREHPLRFYGALATLASLTVALGYGVYAELGDVTTQYKTCNTKHDAIDHA